MPHMRINGTFLVRGLLAIALLTVLLLAVGGRVGYWQAWAFGAVNLALVTALATALAERSGIIRARMKAAPGTKSWDFVILALFFPAALAVPVVGALDGGRLAWSAPLPVWIYGVAYVLYVGGAYLHLWAILANVFYTSTVAIQITQGHRVETGGPYRFVRHPGYLGIICMEAAMAVALGSIWALLPAAFVAILLSIRCGLEDATLHRELPGYPDYARTVRYRILPGVW
jgi:protein-S-isoprenylcysteine O-methyltransferase Ste14